MKNLKNYLMAISCLLASSLAFSQISVTTESDATVLANALIGSESGITIVSATYIGDENAAGLFNGGDFGISEGIILTSGQATNAIGPNDSEGTTSSNSQPGDPDLDLVAAPFLTQDACILEIEFIPDASSIEFTYVFGSEEYNEWVCSSYNDVFAFYVDGGTYSNQNIALLPGTDPPVPVSINNVNNGSVGSSGSMLNCTEDQLANSSFYIDNFEGTNIEYDGYTVTLSAVINVVPGTTYTLKLALADAGDGVLDSGVFLEGNSFVAVNCDAGGISYVDSDANVLEYCINDLPSSVAMSNSGEGDNDSYAYIVTDEAGDIVYSTTSSSLNLEGFNIGDYSVYGVSYSGNLIGLNGNIEDLTSDGCFDQSESLTLIINPCYDCEELEAYIGDSCDDGNENTENDMITAECECEGTSLEVDCPELGLNVGDSCDDGDENTENDIISENCVCAGTPPQVDCPELGLNIGDPCELAAENGVVLNAMGVVSPECLCLPLQPGPGCNDWRYYFADIANNGVTDIYEVTLNGNFADLSLLAISDEEVHIAFGESTKLLYLVRKSDGAVSLLDPTAAVPVLGPWNLLSMNIPGVVTATIAPDDKLVIGSESQDQLYSVDLNSFMVSSYDTYSPISGGDIEFDSNGALYLASSFGLFLNNTQPASDQFLATLNNQYKVTGLALTDNDDLISSHVGFDQFLVHDVSGAPLGSFDVRLNGNPHVTNFGDMTSGCMPPDEVPGDCQAFSTYYVHHGAGVAGSDLYEVSFSGSDANLTFLTNVPFEAHIAYNAMADLIYFVNKSGSFVRFYDPTANAFQGDLPLAAGLTQLTATVYNDSDGYLYVGSDNQDKVFQVDLNTGAHVFYANAPVSGGDLALKNNELYLASRTGNSLHKFVAGVPVLLGNVPVSVTGLAQANNNAGLIVSSNGTSNFVEVDAANGNTLNTYAAKLGGAPFTLLNGDMTAGCADDDQGEEGCQDFVYYYIADNHPGVPQGNVYGGLVNGGDFELTYLFNAGFSGHIAISETNGNIYVVQNNGGSIRTFNSAGVLLNSAPLSGLNSTYALVWHKADGLIYVGNANSDQVYTVDPATGVKTLFANNMPVQGGDLISTDTGELLLVKRDDNGPSKVYDISSGIAVFLYDVSSSINGAAVYETGGSIMAEGDNSLNFHIYDAAGVPGAVLNSVDDSGNPFPLFDGDMASGCMDNVIVPPTPAGSDVINESHLQSYPNPTIGQSQVVFETNITGRATLEVFDMNGRSIATLYNQVAEEGLEYRIDFNSGDLPNGIYIYKLTTANEVVMSKFMIAR